MDESSTHQHLEPNYGRRLIVNLVDEVAALDPSRPFVFVPRSSEPKDGWKPVTYREISNAVNYVAHDVSDKVQKKLQQEPFPTLAYIGPNDIRYVIFELGCIKAGCKALFISPRNSVQGQLSLFKATNCNFLFYDKSYESAVQLWLREREMKLIVVPSVNSWLQSSATPFPYSRTFDDAKWDPIVVFHTSGSTGIPKPIVHRHGSYAISDAFHNMPDYQGAQFIMKEWMARGKKVFLPMPLFHVAGCGFLIISTVYYGAQICLGIPDRPISAELVAECLTPADVDGAVLPPSILEELSLSDQGIEQLSKLSYVIFVGGNLSPATGNQLVKRGVNLSNFISTTEYAPYPLYFQSNPELWQYFVFNDDIVGAEWRSWGEDVYEYTIRRKHPEDPGLQMPFYTFPELMEWRTKDLYKAHPTLPHHWCYQGRVDNIIVFSNGEKLNPVTMEEIITGHPTIKGALIVGQDRFQPALILEPYMTPQDSAEAEALIDSIWPLIEDANKQTVANGVVVRRLVALSDPDRPFLRAGKGTVQRGQTVDAYKDYIDSIYAHAEGADPSESIVLELSSKESLTQSIIDLFTSKIGAQGIGPDTDFFSAGVDSLQVISASHLLRSGFKAAGISIDPSAVATRVIYGNPTPKDLAYHLYAIISNNPMPSEDELARETRITAELVSKYAENLPVLKTDKPSPLDNGQTVLLTGTTGSLGAYILDRLCSLPRVKKIIALNRGHDGGSLRQLSSNAARGLGTDFSKVEFIEADLSLPDLGLPLAGRMRLLATVDRVIHNAWPVNFNISVASFEPHIRGVRHLVDFASAAEKCVPVVFVSSIGTADGWSSSVPVPERRIDDLALPQTGYGRSKLAASLILDAAADRSGVPTASVRVGQIAGPRGRKGVWNRQEYLPSLIASSVYLGVLPQHLGPQEAVEWIPVEDMSELILDVAGITSTVQVSEISGYFHGVNPSSTRWPDLAISLKEFYAGRIKELVNLDEWVAALEKSAEMPTDTDKNPAVKLLDTYRSMLMDRQQGGRHAGFQVERTLGRSPALATVGPITPELMKNWCEQWGF